MSHGSEQTIVILGAHGRIGMTAAKAFLSAGWRVRGVARGEKAKRLPAGVESVVADASNRDALVAACAGADVILHALNPPYDRWRELVMPMAQNVLAAAKATGATVMIPGNVYGFGNVIGLETAENAPQVASNEKAGIRIAMESLFETAAADGVRTIVLRAGDYFGGTQPGTWLDLAILKDLRKDRFTFAGPEDVPHAWAYVPDFAEAFVRVAEKRSSLPPFATLHFRGHTMSGREMKAAVEEAVGRTLRPARVNWLLLRIVGMFSPVVREVVRMNYLWFIPHSLANGRLERLIGPEPHTPATEALGQAIADLRLDRQTDAAGVPRAA